MSHWMTPYAWSMIGGPPLPYHPTVGGFGAQKTLTGVTLGASETPDFRARILVPGVDAQKVANLLYHPKNWTVDASLIANFDVPFGGRTLTVKFEASASGKFAGLEVTGAPSNQRHSIWSTNRRPQAHIDFDNFDLSVNNGSSVHTAALNYNGSGLYQVNFYRAFGTSADDMSDTATCQDASGVQSGSATYVLAALATTDDPDDPEFSSSGALNIEPIHVYLKPDGTADILCRLESYFGGAAAVVNAYGIEQDSETLRETATATILGVEVPIYLYSSSNTTITYNLTYDITPTELWDY